MKQSKMYVPMLKDVSNQAIAISHIYALKAGLIHQNAAGIYSYLPMAVKMISNIEKIVREELEKIDANEVILPLLEPAELWKKTGRWNGYGNELFRVVDRKNTEFALAPTHEEIITDLVKNNLNSYKKYPVNLFQIATKMRDEARPRFGLLRGREFIMMDGYSFHTNDECLLKTYEKYYQVYINIFNRIGLDFKIVKADNGQMGGTMSHEFMALADIGEDTIVYQDDQEIGYNLEVAPIYHQVSNSKNNIKEISSFETPNTTRIKDLVEKHSLDVSSIIKTIAYKVNDQFIFVVLRGDHEVNELKIINFLKLNEDLSLATDEDLLKLGIEPGYIGPLNVENKNIEILIDQAVQDIEDGICGSNIKNTHYKGINYNRDLKNFKLLDLRVIQEGDYMFENSKPVKFARGIEIGHIFALGDKYAKDLNVEFLSKEQKKNTPVMGCYGIGISRLLSAIIEQSHDENGIIMPKSISPFDIHIVVLDFKKNIAQQEYSLQLYQAFEDLNYKILLDDRDERPGVKLSECDLLGVPIRIVIGKSLSKGFVEIKFRNSEEIHEIPINNVINFISKNK